MTSLNEVRATPSGRPLTGGAVALILLLCLSWGFNQIAIKIALSDIPPFTMAAIRSVGALAMIGLVAWLRGVPLFARDGTLRAGLFAGLLFGVEFVLIYRGLTLTNATRAVIFIYTAPFFVALGAKPFLREPLSRIQWAGLALSFAGMVLAIGMPQADVTASVLLGDLMMIGGAMLWAGTTLVVKATPLLHAPAEKTLGYQLAVSIPILAFCAWLFGESVTVMPGPVALASLAYQTFWVVGITFLLWFMLIRTYSASKLSSFTFIAPLFGVAGGYFIMNDPLTPSFAVAAVMVIAGLYMVNRPSAPATDPLLPAAKL